MLGGFYCAVMFGMVVASAVTLYSGVAPLVWPQRAYVWTRICACLCGNAHASATYDWHTPCEYLQYAQRKPQHMHINQTTPNSNHNTDPQQHAHAPLRNPDVQPATDASISRIHTHIHASTHPPTTLQPMHTSTHLPTNRLARPRASMHTMMCCTIV